MAKEMLTQMNARQKVIMLATLVIFVIIIWQVMSLFSDATPTSNANPSTVPAQAANRNQGSPPEMRANSAFNNSSSSFEQPQPMAQQPIRQLPNIPNDYEFNKMQKQTEERYVGKLNELEELKIQRQIAETNQAISAAKLATVTAEKNISDLLIKPASPTPPPPVDYASQLAGPTPTASTEAVVVEQKEVPLEYSVISVSMQHSKWSAVLGFQGKLFSVSVGDILPADGSEVVSINRNSVTLKKDGMTKKISMVSSI